MHRRVNRRKKAGKLVVMRRRNPEVSIIMTVYNGEKYLDEAITSILNQTYRDFEFIIVNDGSRDGSRQILEGYADERIRLHHQPNQGRVSALNNAIELAKGKYIANIDQDDLSLPRRIERQVEFLENHAEVGMIGTARVSIDEKGRRGKERIYPTTDISLRLALIKGNPFFHSSIMFRRAVFRKVGLYNGAFDTFGHDRDLYLRIARDFEIANLAEVLAMKRKHPGQLSRKAAKEERAELRLRFQLRAVREVPYPFYLYPYILALSTMIYIAARVPLNVKRSMPLQVKRSLKRLMG